MFGWIDLFSNVNQLNWLVICKKTTNTTAKKVNKFCSITWALLAMNYTSGLLEFIDELEFIDKGKCIENVGDKFQ